MNCLAEREPSLAAYVLASGYQIAETIRTTGAPEHLIEWANDEVIARLLVALQAQRQAQLDLWRDFMGDERLSDGEQHG
jgi:hypothetical protein